MFGRWRPRRPLDPLDARLLWWAPGEPLTVRQLLNGGIAIFGSSGSGKTSSSGRLIGKSLISHRGSGGCILAAKPEDLAFWRGIFAACGRSDDLIVFGSLRSRWRFNVLDYVRRLGGSTRDITGAIRTIGKTLRSGGTQRGTENGDFFEAMEDRLLYCAVELVRQAHDRVTAPDLQRFITTAAYSPEQIGTAEWQAEFHNQCIKAAFARRKTTVEAHDFELARDFWLAEFPRMADKTRSSVLAGVMSTLHCFNSGEVRELLSTTTTVSPHDTFRGRWVLVNTPPASCGDTGRFTCAAWKYLCQQANLRRRAGPNSPIHVIWADEAQMLVNEFDAHYLAQCRSHNGCLIFITQSLASYYAALPGETGRHQTDALFANFRHKILHSLSDVQTAEWASNLIGKSLQTFIGGSSQEGGGGGDPFDALFGRSHYSGSFSEHFEHIVQSNVFLSGLRTGGPGNGFLADAILIRSGEPFADGNSFLRCSFSQKG